jgi:hypothetical protein
MRSGCRSPARLGAEELTASYARRKRLFILGGLKRVFGIDIETCPACGGAVRIIARIARRATARPSPAFPT